MPETDVLQNFRGAYSFLQDQVIRALHIHIGDTTRLNEQKRNALQLLQSAEQHRNIFPAAEYAILQQSITDIIEYLDLATYLSSDPPDESEILVSGIQPAGQRGRPRIEIDSAILQESLNLRGPLHLAIVFGCSSRTIRRRALEYNLCLPGHPVYTTITQEDGTTRTLYNSVNQRQLPLDISDEQLDTFISSMLQVFPEFGRSMLKGCCKAAGLNVSRQRIRASYLRVHGPPPSFNFRRIVRRKYEVPGANSLWHHDGQHGLIAYKIVIHAFIDGKSRLVTGIQVSNNNRSETVLAVFLSAISRWGVPSRVRGDHGWENILVAAWMLEHQGLDRGSYIWGRSVHNTRIERLWYDVTQGFGKKWYRFFLDLEHNHGLDPSNPSHIWLLHHLFLHCIQQDAQEWAEAWNNHQITINGERERSPRDIFFFSQIQDGPRGIYRRPEPLDIPLMPDEIHEYGIDWEVISDSDLMAHLLHHNPEEWRFQQGNPMTAGPEVYSRVDVEPPNSPLTPVEVEYLNLELSSRMDCGSRDMVIRRLMWDHALEICNSFFTS